MQHTTGEDAPTRVKILRATLDLLERCGYSMVTTDAIAAEARVSKATIYLLWPTKQHIVVDAARLRLGPIEVRDLGSFEAEVRSILEHRLADYRDPGTLRLVGSLAGAATADATLKTVFVGWIEQLSDAIHESTERGINRGDVRPSVDTYALESLIAGVVARTVITQQSFSPTMVEELAALIAAAAAPEQGSS